MTEGRATRGVIVTSEDIQVERLDELAPGFLGLTIRWGRREECFALSGETADELVRKLRSAWNPV
jgi:hypothetical protein